MDADVEGSTVTAPISREAGIGIADAANPQVQFRDDLGYIVDRVTWNLTFTFTCEQRPYDAYGEKRAARHASMPPRRARVP
jgi:hypothetical protein